MKKKFCLGLATGMLIATCAGTVSALPVTTELVLLADVSGSLDSNDFTLQRNGYANAFRSSAVQNAIETYGDLAVTLVYWSSGQRIAVDWTHVYDMDSANAFADNIMAYDRPFTGMTAMANAMDFATSLFVADNGYEGTRLVMDVSGDGAEGVDCSFANPTCSAVQTARDNAITAGVDNINALFIDDRNYFGDDPEDTIDAVLYGQTNVIAGAGSFVNIVDDFYAFEAAVTDKIVREIGPTNPVPEPATMLLFGTGLVGLVASRLRKKKK